MLTSGVGVSPFDLVSFDNALIDAGLSNYNLLRVSSILPMQCQEAGVISQKEGSLISAAYGFISSNVHGDVISSAIGVGIPENKNQVGVIMECAGHYSAEEAKRRITEMTCEAMKNHKIPCKEIKVSSAEAHVSGEEYITVLSAVAMW